MTLVGAAGDERLPEGIERASEQRLALECDIVLALGGDGTMLNALRLAAPHAIPTLGINLGRLGYLAEVDREHLGRALTVLSDGGYSVEDRTGLALRPVANTGLQETTAFNDVVFSRVPGRGQAALELRVDDELLVRYSSDGVIVATAQGSTAYSFAAGGPLVSPRARGMIITPDAPHGLFNRAVVLTDDERLTVELLPGAPTSLEVDGRLVGHAQAGARFDLTARHGAAHVVRIQPNGFPERARRKLGITDPAVLADHDLAGHER